jgi:hypothetical protein
VNEKCIKNKIKNGLNPNPLTLPKDDAKQQL